MKSKKNLAPKIILSLFTLAIALACAEIYVRIFHPPAPSIMFQPMADHMHKNRLEAFAGVIEADDQRFWKLVPGQTLPETAPHIRGLISNLDGLREDHEIPLEKAENEIRILFLGDSCTFGFDHLNVETFVDQTERGLQEKFPDRKIECINAGVPGYTIYQGWRVLEQVGLKYNPDMVVVTFGWNDTRVWSNMTDLQHYEVLQAGHPPPPFGWSRLLGKILRERRIRRLGLKEDEKQPRVPREEFEEILLKISEITRQRNIDLLTVVWPLTNNFKEDGSLKTNDYQQTVIDLSENSSNPKIDHLNLIPVYAEQIKGKHLKRMFIDFGHSTERANHRIAEALVEKLTPWIQEVKKAP